MYRVAVCEDERQLRERLCADCGEILTGMEVEHQVTPFSSAEELENVLEECADFDLLCMDILLTGKTGMELAQELRQWDEQTSILFVTGSTEFLLEGYDVRPIQYLLKPVERKELEQAIQTDLRLNHRTPTVTVKGGGRTALLPWPDIRYVESRNHGSVFHMTREEQFFPIPLSQTEGLLPKGRFSRCHNSFLVNLAQIKETTSRDLLLANGERLPLGRRYSERFQSEFIHYLNEY